MLTDDSGSYVIKLRDLLRQMQNDGSMDHAKDGLMLVRGFLKLSEQDRSRVIAFVENLAKNDQAT